ncbi:F510_1955 family glycosylhydrolase [Bacillus marinisedimentorum]|uniref:F510_1955 family glycosylhydrolase n=1 Tax=Bacillus marinisedimentorum TaxID=1821260 RepID=UPI0007E24457|nr:hypothetical protein [Bacillus marinisedimentorum]
MKKTIMASALSTVLLLGACSGDETAEPETDQQGEETQNGEKSKESNKNKEENQKQNTESFTLPAESDFYKEASDKQVEHIHGIGYAGGKDAVFAASHEGLIAYQDGKWYETKEENHDYMGFQAVDSGFFASGHPESGSDLKNPLGLVKSENGGKSFEKQAFYGETDFHHMTAGYNNHMIYVVNQQPNSELQSGVYYSENEGENWKESKIEGFPAKPVALYAHPQENNKVAVAAADGIYLSDDYADTFKKVTESFPATAMAFKPEGGFIAATLRDEKAGLAVYSKESEKQKDIALPDISDDVIYYVAVSPENPEEFVISTEQNNMYQTKDAGENWTQLMDAGELLTSE